MTLSPRHRKVSLTAHVTSSVGWLGAVVCSLALAVVGLASRDAQVVRSVYLTMELVGWYVLIPLSVVSLLTGLVQSLGTRWGLFRHYWVVVKLVINVVASAVLLLYMQTLGYLADLAANPTGDLEALRSPSAVSHASGAVVLLVLATLLSVFKPAGLTRYGQRKTTALSLSPG